MIAAAVETTEPVYRLTTQTRVLAVILAVLFMVFIVELIRRDKLLERYSIVWFAAGALMIIGALVPQPLELLADLMGVRDLTIALFSLVLIVLLALALNFSVIASRHTKQITRLAQERAVETLREPDWAELLDERGRD
jgi:hypothetical protein